jgi:hypothetical protein
VDPACRDPARPRVFGRCWHPRRLRGSEVADGPTPRTSRVGGVNGAAGHVRSGVRAAKCLAVAGLLVVSACAGASGGPEAAPTTTLHPDDQAMLDGFFALCNDGNYSNNDDFDATCSGGDGIARWLSDYGECVDGTVMAMRSIPDCSDRGGFAGLLARDFEPTAAADDVALCNDGNFSNNTDFRATCSGGDGVDRWLAPYGECTDGTVIGMASAAECPSGADFKGLLPLDYEPPAPTTTARPTTTTSTTTTVPATTIPPSTTVPGSLSALDILATINVENEQQAGYDRTLFAYGDIVDNRGCNTRSVVLIEESVTPAQVDFSGCAVVAGDWLSAYDGVTWSDPGELEVDHVVALKEAWDSGAWAWTSERRSAYGNDVHDPRSLRAVTSSVNQSKGAADPSNWLPPDPSFVCTYLSDWISIKARWGLSMDSSEHGRIRNVLTERCPDQMVAPWPETPPPAPANTAPPPPPVTAAPALPVAPTPPAPPAGNCDPSYPDVCIPPAPPDLDCGDISYRRFRVLPPDLTASTDATTTALAARAESFCNGNLKRRVEALTTSLCSVAAEGRKAISVAGRARILESSLKTRAASPTLVGDPRVVIATHRPQPACQPRAPGGAIRTLVPSGRRGPGSSGICPASRRSVVGRLGVARAKRALRRSACSSRHPEAPDRWRAQR